MAKLYPECKKYKNFPHQTVEKWLSHAAVSGEPDIHFVKKRIKFMVAQFPHLSSQCHFHFQNGKFFILIEKKGINFHLTCHIFLSLLLHD